MTFRDAVALVRSDLSGSGFISDENTIPARRILSQLKTTLTLLKHRNLAKNILFETADIFTLDCVQMEEVDQSLCPTIPPSGYTWTRSVEAIPNFIKLMSVTDLLGRETFPVITWNRIHDSDQSRNPLLRKTKKSTFKTERGGTYLYILNSKLESVSTSFVPEDYMEAVLFPRCGEVDMKLKCNPWDIEVGASYNLIKEASTIIVSEQAKYLGIKPDLKNNDNPM